MRSAHKTFVTGVSFSPSSYAAQLITRSPQFTLLSISIDNQVKLHQPAEPSELVTNSDRNLPRPTNNLQSVELSFTNIYSSSKLCMVPISYIPLSMLLYLPGSSSVLAAEI